MEPLLYAFQYLTLRLVPAGNAITHAHSRRKLDGASQLPLLGSGWRQMSIWHGKFLFMLCSVFSSKIYHPLYKLKLEKASNMPFFTIQKCQRRTYHSKRGYIGRYPSCRDILQGRRRLDVRLRMSDSYYLKNIQCHEDCRPVMPQAEN